MKILYLAFCAFILSCEPIEAEIAVNDLPAVFEATCQELSVPQDVTMAIAQVESGFKPWAVNIEGRSYQFMAIARQKLKKIKLTPDFI